MQTCSRKYTHVQYSESIIVNKASCKKDTRTPHFVTPTIPPRSIHSLHLNGVFRLLKLLSGTRWQAGRRVSIRIHNIPHSALTFICTHPRFPEARRRVSKRLLSCPCRSVVACGPRWEESWVPTACASVGAVRTQHCPFFLPPHFPHHGQSRARAPKVPGDHWSYRVESAVLVSFSVAEVYSTRL